jgi:hypothetical protein
MRLLQRLAEKRFESIELPVRIISCPNEKQRRSACLRDTIVSECQRSATELFAESALIVQTAGFPGWIEKGGTYRKLQALPTKSRQLGGGKIAAANRE